MCAATNLVNFTTYWNAMDTPVSGHTGLENSFLTDAKSNLLRRPMLIVNNINNKELYATCTEGTLDEVREGKHFLASINTFQVAGENNLVIKTDTEDCKPNTNQKVRPFSCNECGKTFLLKHHLTTHEKTHSGIKPHSCIHCGKSFTHKHSLNTHLLLHSSQRPYQCTECKKSFTLKHHLLSHTRVSIGVISSLLVNNDCTFF